VAAAPTIANPAISPAAPQDQRRQEDDDNRATIANSGENQNRCSAEEPRTR